MGRGTVAEGEGSQRMGSVQMQLGPSGQQIIAGRGLPFMFRHQVPLVELLTVRSVKQEAGAGRSAEHHSCFPALCSIQIRLVRDLGLIPWGIL